MRNEIAEAINRLAEAERMTAAATRDLVIIRQQELVDAEKVRAERTAADVDAREAWAAFSKQIDSVRPALQMLIAIAKTMRGEP